MSSGFFMNLALNKLSRNNIQISEWRDMLNFKNVILCPRNVTIVHFWCPDLQICIFACTDVARLAKRAVNSDNAQRDYKDDAFGRMNLPSDAASVFTLFNTDFGGGLMWLIAGNGETLDCHSAMREKAH
jgi:hypothetical protein